MKHLTRGRNAHLEMEGIIGKYMKINKRFAVDANNVCYYRNYNKAFNMKFNQDIVMQDIREITPISIENNLWKNYRGLLTHCFMHEQEMIYEIDLPK